MAGKPSCLVLGDNIFHGHGLREVLRNADQREQGATVFGYWVNDPERYGVAEFDKDGKGITVDEVVMMAEKMSMSASSDEIETMFADADTDKSGRMSFEEFHAAFNAHLGMGEIVEKARQRKARNDSLGRLFLLVFLL